MGRPCKQHSTLRMSYDRTVSRGGPAGVQGACRASISGHLTGNPPLVPRRLTSVASGRNTLGFRKCRQPPAGWVLCASLGVFELGGENPITRLWNTRQAVERRGEWERARRNVQRRGWRTCLPHVSEGGRHSALRRHRYPTPRKNAIPPAGSTLTLESTVDDCATRLATAALSRFLLAMVRFWLLLLLLLSAAFGDPAIFIGRCSIDRSRMN